MDERSDLDLRHYVRVLRRRSPIIALVMIFAIGAAVAFTVLSTRVYAATTTLLLGSTTPESVFSNLPAFQDPASRATQIQIMQSRELSETVAKKLGADAAKVRGLTAEGVVDTNLATITVKSANPRVAQRAANLYATTYVSTRQKQAVDSLLAASTIVTTKLAELQTRLSTLEQQIESADPAPSPELRTARDAVSLQVRTYQEKLDQLQVDAALKSGGAQVVEKAAAPTSPIEPRPIRDVGLAALLGLVLGTAAAFAAEFLDDKMHTSEDVARYGNGLTVLAEIPPVPGWRDRKAPRVVTLTEPGSITAEAYRSLRTSVQLIALRKPLRSLLVTSPMAAEGKTTTAVNLAVTIARTGQRVVLVDLDFRRPRIAQFFDVPDVGVTSVLLGDASLAQAIREIPISSDVPPLAVLPSGPIPSNPSELLGTDRVAEFVASLQSVADLVIMDSPPLLPVTDALVLSHRVDGVLIVVGVGQTRRRHLRAAVELLEQADAPILGGVLNASTGGQARRRYGYGYGVTRNPYVGGNGQPKTRVSVPR